MDSIQVEFVGMLIEKIGVCKSSVMIDDSITVRSLIQRLMTDFNVENDILRDWDTGSLEQRVLILINGKEISVLEGAETRLVDGDLVSIIPISHGG